MALAFWLHADRESLKVILGGGAVDEAGNFLLALLEPNVAYLIFATGAWLTVLALLVPGSGIIEVAASLGLIAGLGGLASRGASALGLALIVVSFVVYALADLRAFRIQAPRSESLLANRWLQSVIIIMALVSLAIHQWVMKPILAALRPPPFSGAETLIGERAVVRRAAPTPGQPGMAFLRGERWEVVADQPLEEGDTVEVIRREGMRLIVHKAAHDGNTS